jgi:hypothetical protein
VITNEQGEPVHGTLENSVVMENENAAYGVYKREDGVYSIHKIPLTERDLAIYRSSPETFFGVRGDHPSRRVVTPLDLYDFFFGSYSQSTREKLLEFMATAPDFEQLKQLDQTQLAEEYSARLATSAWNQSDRTGTQAKQTFERPPT